MTESLLQQARELSRLHKAWSQHEGEQTTRDFCAQTAEFLDAVIEHLEERPLIVYHGHSRDGRVEVSNSAEYDRNRILEFVIQAIKTNERGIADVIKRSTEVEKRNS